MLEEDAVIAVLLCEKSVTLKQGSSSAHLKTRDDNTVTKEAIKCALMYFCPSTGASVLVIPPDPVFSCDMANADILRKRDATLDALHQNILQFIYAYAPGAETYITEE